MPDITCSISGVTIATKATSAGNPRLPRGWKRIADKYYSPASWHDRYCIRAIVVPVASPVDIGQGTRDEWDALNEQFGEAWQRSTEAANWAVKQLLANDVTRQSGDTKCPPMPSIYLYGLRDWTGWSQSAASVLRTVEQTYRASRYEIVWLGGRRIANQRYPYPYPVHNAGWQLNEQSDGGIMFTVTLPSGRRSMRLRGGHRYRRQLAGLRHLIVHPELRGEASIYRRGNEVVVKVVGWFPRKTNEHADGTLFLRTGKAEFLIGLNDADERLFIFNGDRCRRWIVRHANGLQRWREDMKFERRRPKRESRKHAEDMQDACIKTNNRIKSFIDETAAQCVNHASRRRLARIVLDDSERSYFQDFQWHRLSELLAQKANAAGIHFERSSAAKTSDTSRVAISAGIDT